MANPTQSDWSSYISARVKSCFKLHKAAYYGNFRNFIEYYDDDLALENVITLRKCLLNGCIQDKNLALYCYKHYFLRFKSNPEFIAICLTHGIWISDMDLVKTELILRHLEYIPETNLLKLIEYSEKSDKLKEICVYLIILNEYDLFDKIHDWKKYLNNDPVKGLINNLNMTDIDVKKFELMDFPFIPSKSKMIYDNCIVPGPLYDAGSLSEFPNYNLRAGVIREFLEYDILCEEDDAIMGRLPRAETLSIFYFYDPEFAHWFLAEEKPDLTFHKMIITPDHWKQLSLIDEKYVDNALYSCIDGGYKLKSEDFDILTHVDYDCLQLARSNCYGFVLKMLKKVYERTGKCQVELNEDNFTPTKFKLRR